MCVGIKATNGFGLLAKIDACVNENRAELCKCNVYIAHATIISTHRTDLMFERCPEELE